MWLFLVFDITWVWWSLFLNLIFIVKVNHFVIFSVSFFWDGCWWGFWFILIFSRFNCEFVEELLLVLQLSVFVNSHSCVWRSCGDHLETRMNRYTLNELFVAFECLNFLEFATLNRPHDCRSIKWPWNKITGIIWPREIHHISHMTSELSWLTPLNFFFDLTKFNRHRFELPYDY